MNILFLCKANLFRSRMAHEFFDIHNSNLDIKTDSAALIYDFDKPHNLVVKAMEEINIDISKKIPKKVNQELINWADLIVLMFPDLEEPLFEYELNDQKIEIWNIEDLSIPDDNISELKKFIKARNEIEIKIKEFIENLNKNI